MLAVCGIFFLKPSHSHSVVNIFKKRETVGGAAATPGYALTYAHDRKMSGASEACRAAGITFIPIVFESLGGVHQKTEAEVRKLASAMASRSGQEEEEESRHSFNRLG